MGRTALEAFDRLEVLESTAETIMHASRLGSVELLSEEESFALTVTSASRL